MKTRFANFVIQNSICTAADAGELDSALICDLSNSNNMLGAACRARNDVAIGAHVDFSNQTDDYGSPTEIVAVIPADNSTSGGI